MLYMFIQGFQLAIILHIPIYQCTSIQRGNCYSSTPRSRQDTNPTGFYCCDFFEDINNTCIECMNGYISSKGTPCKPCAKGFYGGRCENSCHCVRNERCDNVQGCVNLTTTDDEAFKKDTASTSSRQQSITESVMETNDTVNGDTELLKIQPILIYIICAGIMITITSAIMIYRKKIKPGKSKEVRMVVEEQHRVENIETDHYLTVL